MDNAPVSHTKLEDGLDHFDFHGKLGPIGFEYVREQVKEFGGRVISGSAESRSITVEGLLPDDAQWITAIDLPHLVTRLVAS
jgi:hypothetical protein